MRPIFALAMKDLRLLLRDRGNAFFTFVFPILFAIFFGIVFSGSGGSSPMSVALVDEDGSDRSAAFAEDLAAADGVKVTRVTHSEGPTPVAVTLTRAAGEALVRRGKAVACIVIPKGFGESSGNVLAGQPVRVEALMDPSRNAEAGLLTGKLNEIALMQLGKSFNDPVQMKSMVDKARETINKSSEISGPRKLLFNALFSSMTNLTGAPNKAATDIDTGTGTGTGPGGVTSADAGTGGGLAWRPIDVSVTRLTANLNEPRNSYEISFPQGVAWGLMGCVTAFGPSLASERARGTLMRLTTAPISRRQILLGKALACFIACVTVQTLLMLVAVLFFKVQVRQPGVMLVAVLCSSLGFVGIMMLMAGMSRTEGSASGMGRALVLILAMIGGGTIPLFLLPPFMQTMSSVSPFKWAILAFEGAIWRGFGWGDMLLPCVVLVGFAVVGFVVGAMFFRWGERFSD